MSGSRRPSKTSLASGSARGALMNMLRRAQDYFVAGREQAVAELRQAKVVSSDETGVRIEGSNAYHWVFRCDQAVVHQAAPTRGAVVIRNHDGRPPARGLVLRPLRRPAGSCGRPPDLSGHLARDVAYALGPQPGRLGVSSPAVAAKGFRPGSRHHQPSPPRPSPPSAAPWSGASTISWLLRARANWRKPSQNKFRRAHNQLLTFARWPGEVQATNNACERDLRPAVIQRKVTNGYRAMWAAQGEADVRTVIDTARLAPGANPSRPSWRRSPPDPNAGAGVRCHEEVNSGRHSDRVLSLENQPGGRHAYRSRSFRCVIRRSYRP